MMKTILCTVIFVIRLLNQVALTSGQEAPVCDAIRLEGPFIPTLQWIMGAAYNRSNFTYNNRAVFHRQLGSGASYVYYCGACSRWIIGPQLGGTNASMYIESNVSNPIDIKGVWYANISGSYRPFQNVFLRCINKSCQRVILKGPNVLSQNGLMGAIFTQTNTTVDERPVFKFNTTNNLIYMVYNSNFSAWVVTNDNPDSHRGFRIYAPTTANHPTEAREWYVVQHGMLRERFDVTVECFSGVSHKHDSKERTENCTSLRITGLENLQLPGVSKSAYRKIDTDAKHKPIFYVRDLNVTSYIYHSVDDYEVEYWSVGSSPNSTATLKSVSYDQHPADTSHPWILFDGENVTKVFREVHIGCAKDQENSQRKRQSDHDTIIALVIATVVLTLCAIVFGFLWRCKRYIHSDTCEPYIELENANFDVFICYKSKGCGEQFVSKSLIPVIRDNWGQKLATDVPHYVSGREHAETEEALEQLGSSKRIILVLTFDFLDCDNCNYKWTSALTQRENRLATIVTLLLEDVSAYATGRKRQKLKKTMEMSKCLRVPKTHEGQEWEKLCVSLRKALLVRNSTSQGDESPQLDRRSERSVMVGPLVERVRILLLRLFAQSRDEASPPSHHLIPEQHKETHV